MEGTGDLLDLTLRAFLTNLASDEPAPAAGSAAALVVTMGAALLAKVARASTDWPDAQSAVAQAERIRKRTAPLAQSDADVYLEALAALHLPDQLESEVRDMALGQVLVRAAEIPLVIAEAGADVACLAVEVVERGIQERRPEAVAAAMLACSGTQVAVHLIEENLIVTPEDEILRRARAVSELASAATRTALRSSAA